MNGRSPRVAFVHYPHSPNAARPDTMPFALTSVRARQAGGAAVDVYLWENAPPDERELGPVGSVTLSPEYDGSRLMHRLRPIELRLRFLASPKYDAVFAVGQIGIFVGRMIAQRSGCPLIYLND